MGSGWWVVGSWYDACFNHGFTFNSYWRNDLTDGSGESIDWLFLSKTSWTTGLLHGVKTNLTQLPHHSVERFHGAAPNVMLHHAMLYSA